MIQVGIIRPEGPGGGGADGDRFPSPTISPQLSWNGLRVPVLRIHRVTWEDFHADPFLFCPGENLANYIFIDISPLFIT